LQKGYLKIHGIPGKGRGKVIRGEKQMMIIHLIVMKKRDDYDYLMEDG